MTNGENGVTKDEGIVAKEKNDVAEEPGAVADNENAAVQEESAEAENESAVTEDQSAEVEEEGIGAKDWYVIHVYSGFENKVKLSLEERFAYSGLTDKLGKIIIPTEEVVEIRGGKKKISSRKFYPGYVLISVDMDQDIWYLIKNTPKVTGFPGGATPAPLTATEVKDVMDQIKGEAKAPKPKFIFEKGENVRVIEGPFMNFNGVVEEVNPDKGKVKVMVSIFGRSTPVELEFPQIERV
ncbi:MAG: transcription termination/antitermination protein NusG [Nitrospinaceae bacterium]